MELVLHGIVSVRDKLARLRSQLAAKHPLALTILGLVPALLLLLALLLTPDEPMRMD